jgi:hypothetical protein
LLFFFLFLTPSSFIGVSAKFVGVGRPGRQKKRERKRAAGNDKIFNTEGGGKEMVAPEEILDVASPCVG